MRNNSNKHCDIANEGDAARKDEISDDISQICSKQFDAIEKEILKWQKKKSGKVNIDPNKEEIYRDNYCRILKAYKELEKAHIAQIDGILGKNNDLTTNKLQLGDVLQPLDLNMLKKRKPRFPNFITKNFSSSYFISKLWKNRYRQLMNAFLILHKDYLVLRAVSDSKDFYPNKSTNLTNEDIKSKMTDFCAKEYLFCDDNIVKGTDEGFKIPASFLSDIISCGQNYRCILTKELNSKDSLLKTLEVLQENTGDIQLKVDKLRSRLNKELKREFHNEPLTVQEEKSEEKEEIKQPDDDQRTSEEKVKCLVSRINQLQSILQFEQRQRKYLHNHFQEMMGNIRVICRIKPHPQCALQAVSSDTLLINANNLPRRVVKCWGVNSKYFHFDSVFSPNSSQKEIFDSIAPLITSCVDGFNVCIMAYGQTGSGKTFTMMGTKTDPGVNRRAIEELLKQCRERHLWRYELRLSMVEIYNEEVSDLLTTPNGSNKKLSLNSVKIMTDGNDEITLQGLSEHEVKNVNDIMSYLELGAKNRKVASTMLNVNSSRSHVVLILRVVGKNETCRTFSQGTLTLCDLAGSENIFKSGATGMRFSEATSINKSLSNLGRVFEALRRDEKPPYRESKLTFLLKPMLSGDAKCLLLVNVRSEANNVEETLRALNFAQNAMQVAPEKARLHKYRTKIK